MRSNLQFTQTAIIQDNGLGARGLCLSMVKDPVLGRLKMMEKIVWLGIMLGIMLVDFHHCCKILEEINL